MILPLSGIVYVSWHIWMLLPLANGWKWSVVLLGVVCFLLLFLVFGGTLDRLPLSLSRVLYQVGTSSIIILLYMVLLFLLLDLGRAVHLVPSSWLSGNWWTVAAVFGVLFGVLLCGNLQYKNKVRVDLELTTDKPLAKDYTIVMASDLHLGYHNGRSELARWVDLINAEHPDLVLIAGDVIDISIRPLLEEDMAAEFRRLQAPVYACLGNHEYYSQSQRARQFYQDAGIHLLCDTATLIDNRLLLVGRDDRTNTHRKEVAELVKEALSHVGNSSLEPYIILLDHQPYELDRAEEAGVDFQLSGHTHHGQIWPVSWITDAMYECAWGAHQRGDTRYYVSSGLGIWGGKFRIGTQSEYVVATLTSKR